MTQINFQEQVNAVLPQTQCTRCGYQGCRPYAEALVLGKAEINQCPPGGDKIIQVLATLLDQEIKPLNLKFGGYQTPHVAVIIEKDCIGCAKCLSACPVDAILGASKMMHTVMSHECTGCELCVNPCPVDCIVMKETEFKYSPLVAKQRHEAKQKRLNLLKTQQQDKAKKQKVALMAMMKSKASKARG